jgi:hypothetical protein
MKWIIIPSLLFVLSWPAAAGECPAPGSVVELSGTIGKDLRISMNLTFQKDRLSGSYAYVKYGKEIPLSGTCVGGSLTLQESDASGKPTGSFRGNFTNPQIVEGTWSTPDGKKSLPFHLVAAPPPTAPKVTWTKLVGIKSLADIDDAMLAESERPVEVQRQGGEGKRVTIRNCVDYLGLVANGGEFEPVWRADDEFYHSDKLECDEWQLLKNAHPAQTTFLKDFNFTRKVINILPPSVALLAGRTVEAQTAERGMSLAEFEPSIKVTAADEDSISVETDAWEATISLRARGDFDGKGLEEILILRQGRYKEGGPKGEYESLFILTRTSNTGRLNVVREIR